MKLYPTLCCSKCTINPQPHPYRTAPCVVLCGVVAPLTEPDVGEDLRGHKQGMEEKHSHTDPGATRLHVTADHRPFYLKRLFFLRFIKIETDMRISVS